MQKRPLWPGAVAANNTAAILTFGAQSDGVFPQSVGGGGGKGGASTSTDKSADDGRNQTSVSIGGSNGAGGDGGTVVASNARSASIATGGVLAFGLAAQSVDKKGGVDPRHDILLQLPMPVPTGKRHFRFRTHCARCQGRASIEVKRLRHQMTSSRRTLSNIGCQRAIRSSRGIARAVSIASARSSAL